VNGVANDDVFDHAGIESGDVCDNCPSVRNKKQRDSGSRFVYALVS
jgi:hypothetical protein